MSGGVGPIAIETRDVVKRYAGSTAVNQVSLQVKRESSSLSSGPAAAGKPRCSGFSAVWSSQMRVQYCCRDRMSQVFRLMAAIRI